MKCIIERTVKYDDGKIHISYIANRTLFYTLWGPRQNAMSFDEDVAQKIVMQSRRSDNEIYTVIPLSGEAQGESE